MPMLLIACARCRFLVPTGFHMDRETFNSKHLEGNTARCPNCGHVQIWSKKDVEPVSFES
jgi:hypothetical protein